MKGIGWLVALWLMGQSRSAAAPSSPAPSSPGRVTSLPPIEDLDDGPDLLNPADTPTEADLLWERFAKDPKRPGAPLTAAQLNQTAIEDRKPNAFERWALAPYFPVAMDLDLTLHNGSSPPFTPPGVTIPPNMWALTAAWPPNTTPQIWFPNGVRPLWQRWWLGVLAHELTHGAQVRIGMTPGQAMDAQLQHGYQDSPVERQARWMQRRVLNGLDARARAFYAST